MEIVFDELKLFRGDDYVVNDKIHIHQPTLGEICDFGEQRYFSIVLTLTQTPSDYKVQLFDMGLDYEEIKDIELFCFLVRNIKKSDTKILFGDLDFSKFIPMIKDNESVLYDSQNNITIDKTIYSIIVEYLRTIHRFKKHVDKAGNKSTKKYLIESERRKQKRFLEKNESYKSSLIPLISALTNCEQFKYSYDTIWNLHIYAFYDSVMRIQKIKSYNNIMQGVYAGTVDLNMINQNDINWLGTLN